MTSFKKRQLILVSNVKAKYIRNPPKMRTLVGISYVNVMNRILKNELIHSFLSPGAQYERQVTDYASVPCKLIVNAAS